MSNPDDRESTADDSQIYSLRNILSSFSSTNSGEILKRPTSVVSTPCFKSSFLWSSAVSGAFALHRIYQRATLHQAASTAFLGFLATFSIQWYICRRNEFDRTIALRAYYQQQHDLQTGKHFVPTDTTIVEGDGTEAKEDWQLQLEQLVKQDVVSINRTTANDPSGPIE